MYRQDLRLAAFVSSSSSTKVHMIGMEQVWKHLRSKMTKAQVGPLQLYSGWSCDHALAGQTQDRTRGDDKSHAKASVVLGAMGVVRTRSEMSVEPQSWLRVTLLCEMSGKGQGYQNINQHIATCCVLSEKLSCTNGLRQELSPSRTKVGWNRKRSQLKPSCWANQPESGSALCLAAVSTVHMGMEAVPNLTPFRCSPSFDQPTTHCSTARPSDHCYGTQGFPTSACCLATSGDAATRDVPVFPVTDHRHPMPWACNLQWWSPAMECSSTWNPTGHSPFIIYI